PRLDRVHLAQRAGLDQLFDFVVKDRAGILAADLEYRFGFLLRADHGRPFGNAADHRLFAVNRLAGLHGIDRHPRVPVSGNKDQDGVDVFPRQDLAIVDIGLDLVTEDFLGMRAPALVEIGGSNELDAGNLERTRRIDEADDPHADRGDLKALIRPRSL